MKATALALLLAFVLFTLTPPAEAQLGGGIVHDPKNAIHLLAQLQEIQSLIQEAKKRFEQLQEANDWQTLSHYARQYTDLPWSDKENATGAFLANMAWIIAFGNDDHGLYPAGIGPTTTYFNPQSHTWLYELYQVWYESQFAGVSRDYTKFHSQYEADAERLRNIQLLSRRFTFFLSQLQSQLSRERQAQRLLKLDFGSARRPGEGPEKSQSELLQLLGVQLAAQVDAEHVDRALAMQRANLEVVFELDRRATLAERQAITAQSYSLPNSPPRHTKFIDW